MYDSIISLPKQIEKSLELEIESFDPQYFDNIDKIVFVGMGGSGIVGNIVKDLIDSIPIFVSKNYDPPAFLDSRTLVICISYSGDTKETIESYQIALEKGCKILGLTSGGKLLELLEKEKKPHIKLPKGFLPRVSLPYQLFSLLSFFERLELFNLEKEKIIDFVEKNKEEVDSKAKEIAKRLQNKMVFIYGSRESVCMRFKTQLNENSKMHAKYELFPEINHNEVMGWQSSLSNIGVVFFRDDERGEIKKSIEFLKEIIKVDTVEIFSQGENRFERMVYSIFLGDLISYYLAKQSGIDPEKMEYITELKKVI